MALSKKRGRPPKLDERAKIPEILDQISAGKSLRSICEQEGFPHFVTFLRWVREDEKLQSEYQIAMELRADVQHEEMFEIADDGRNDWMEITNKDGECIGWRVNGEAVARSKLRLDQRKWSAARMSPKKYGDKVDLNHSGKVKVVSLDRDDEAI